MAALTQSEFDNLTLVDAVEFIRNDRITSESLVRETIRRMEARSDLNAFMAVDKAGALEAAKTVDTLRKNGTPPRPLEGVPILVKDNIHVAGLVNSANTPGLSVFIPEHDAPVVAALREAGAIILGKTSMHELATNISGWNLFGQTGPEPGIRNAYDWTRSAGGSSSGNGAALGARIITATLGSDTGGSIRGPAAWNGAAGLRPTMGRYSQTGVTPISFTRDTVGPMAQTVADLELLDRVLTKGSPVTALPSVAGLRFGISSRFIQNLDEDTAEVFHKITDKLQKSGVEIINVEMKDLSEINDKVGFAVAVTEHYDSLVAYLKEFRPHMTIEDLVAATVNPDAKNSFVDWVLPRKIVAGGDFSNLIDALPAYKQAMEYHRPALQKLYRDCFAENRLDGLICPTIPCVAVKANAEASSFATFTRVVQNTEPGSNIGIPGLTIPVALGKKTGMPIGLSIDGPENSDRGLLSIGMALELLFGRILPPARA